MLSFFKSELVACVRLLHLFRLGRFGSHFSFKTPCKCAHLCVCVCWWSSACQTHKTPKPEEFFDRTRTHKHTSYCPNITFRTVRNKHNRNTHTPNYPYLTSMRNVILSQSEQKLRSNMKNRWWWQNVVSYKNRNLSITDSWYFANW